MARKDDISIIDSRVCVDFDRSTQPIVLTAGRIKLYFDPEHAKNCAEALMEAVELCAQPNTNRAENAHTDGHEHTGHE